MFQCLGAIRSAWQPKCYRLEWMESFFSHGDNNLINRLQAILLAVVTAWPGAACGVEFLAGAHNFQQPDDGVWWREAADGSGLMADKVLPNSPGKRAGIQKETF